MRAPQGHLTLYETAERCGLHPKTVTKWLRTGRSFVVPRVIAGRLAFPAAEVDAWIKGRPRRRSVRPEDRAAEVA